MSPDLSELADVSARIGAEPLLVQGPGGNTSLKSEDEIWVKGSGVWLSQALTKPIFTGLSLPAVREALARGQTEDLSAARLPGSDAALRPSIETALHALTPHPCVVHAHAVNSMTAAVLADGKARVAAALDGAETWAWVPYHRPGAPLAAAVAQATAAAPVDVLILQNHGVVVGAETPRLAEARLRSVEARLAFPLRDLPESDGAGGLETEDYEAEPRLSGLALDPELCAILTAAPLIPDQVVFLGGAVPALAPGQDLSDLLARTHAATGVKPALVLVAGLGALVLRPRSTSADSLIQGLYEIARRIPRGAAVHGLPADAAAALLNWDAEKYRQALAAK